jgi:hypothetical protein
VNAYLENPPKIQYENVPFPNLPKEKVVGLVTIKPKSKTSYFKKGIHTILTNSVFVRKGSNTSPTTEKIPFSKQNIETVISLENNSRNSISYTLESVLDFISNRHKDMSANYKVFKELFVVCWAGNKKIVRDKIYYSRVDIELVNEQIKLFYSALDEVSIEFDEDSFSITEYVCLGLNDKTSFYPLEKVTIRFFDNGYYKIDSQMLFEPPQYNKKMLHHIYNASNAILTKLQKGVVLQPSEKRDLINIPHTLMICYLNDFKEAKQKLIDAKIFLKHFENPIVYISFKEVMRILRKMKYGVV